MRLSIITINLNNLDGLKKTIDSIMSQTWRDFEWIIVDGGSTDGSKELIEELASNPQSNISWWCSEKDQGIYNAMNKGIAKSKGDYLNFMNSGDEFHQKDTLSHIFCERKNEDILYGLSEYQFEKGIVVMELPKEITLFFLYENTIFHQSSFIKRSLLKKGYDESLKIVSDWKQWVIWFLEGKTFRYIDIVVSNYDVHGVSCQNIGDSNRERQIVIEEVIPKSFLPELQLLHKYREAEIYYPEIMTVFEVLRKRRLFRRIIKIVSTILNSI